MIYLVIIVLVLVIFFAIKNKKGSLQSTEPLVDQEEVTPPAKLLDLDTTTVADRQRAYRRGYRLQLRYDMLQRQAELDGDTATLESIRTNTYTGPLPELEDDKDDTPLRISTTARKPIDNPKVVRLRYFCIKDKGYHVSVWPKDQGYQGIDYLEFNIAGLSHHDNANYLGEHVGHLVPDPLNPCDSNAIKIIAHDGHHVGFVPKDLTSEVRNFTTLPCRCYFYIGRSDEGTYYSDCYIKL